MLFGFGHRVFKKGIDPRAIAMRKIAKEIFDILGRHHLGNLAFELEEAVLNDEYFKKRGLRPNGNFYTAIIYQAMGFPDDYFPLLFCLARVIGWLAHWNEAC